MIGWKAARMRTNGFSVSPQLKKSGDYWDHDGYDGLQPRQPPAEHAWAQWQLWRFNGRAQRHRWLVWKDMCWSLDQHFLNHQWLIITTITSLKWSLNMIIEWSLAIQTICAILCAFWRVSSHGAIATIGHPAQESQAIRRGHGLAAVLNRVLQCTAPNKGGKGLKKWCKCEKMVGKCIKYIHLTID